MDIKERFYANLEMIREDYDRAAKKDAEDSAAIAKRARNPKEIAFWKKAAKKNKKKAVTGMDEEVEQQNESIMHDVALGLGMGAAGGLLGAGPAMLLHGKYGKQKKSVMDRLYDTRGKKKQQKYIISQADKYIRQSKKPKSIEKWTKERDDAHKTLKNISYLKSLLPEEQLDEISPGKANDAYHVAMGKLQTADIMTGTSDGEVKKKWLKRANKRRNQAVKFADYADKKK